MFVSQIQVLGPWYTCKTYKRYSERGLTEWCIPLVEGPQPWSRSDVFRLQGDVIVLLSVSLT